MTFCIECGGRFGDAAGNSAQLQTLAGMLARLASGELPIGAGLSDALTLTTCETCLAGVRRDMPAPPLNHQIAIPEPDEEVAWTGTLRADLPEYVTLQLREVAHRQRRTLVSLILNMMSRYCDGEGNQVFEIRPEDLVADRRKAIRRKARR